MPRGTRGRELRRKDRKAKVEPDEVKEAGEVERVP